MEFFHSLGLDAATVTRVGLSFLGAALSRILLGLLKLAVARYLKEIERDKRLAEIEVFLSTLGFKAY